MNRVGSQKKYIELVKKIRSALPDAVIRTTFLTGFPGETEEAAQNTFNFLEAIEPDWSGCFPYSREEDTPAYKLKERVPAKVAKERAARLAKRQTEITAEHLQKYVGNEPFLAYNVDIISNVDLKTFYRQHNNENLATILVSDRPTSRYLLFDTSNRLVGWQNAVTGELKTPFANLDVDKYKKLAFNGIHVISPKIFSLMKDFKSPFSITDFYISVCGTESIMGYEQPDLQVTDVGKIEQLKNISNKFI